VIREIRELFEYERRFAMVEWEALRQRGFQATKERSDAEAKNARAQVRGKASRATEGTPSGSDADVREVPAPAQDWIS
jgi:hypothetical protein